MNDFSHVVGWRDTERNALDTALDLALVGDPSACGVDCYVQQQSTQRKWCFCDFLASVDAFLQESNAGQEKWRLGRDVKGGVHLGRQTPETSLPASVFHPDPDVRLSLARRIAESELAPFLDDPDSEVSELAYDRLLAVSKQQIRRLLGECSDDGNEVHMKDCFQ